METMTEPSMPISRRRWLRFSLRTALVFMLVVGVGLGMWVQSARTQWKAVEWVKENGGKVRYENESAMLSPPLSDEGPDPPTWKWIPLPAEWKGWLGRDAEWSVVEAQLNPNETILDITPLTNFHSLRRLSLARASDLRPLSKLTRLEDLMLSGGKVDLAPLEGLESLRNLELLETEVLDPSSLSRLKNLEMMYLRNCLDERKIEELERQLPGCHILYLNAANLDGNRSMENGECH